MKEGLEGIRPAYIWYSQQELNTNKLKRIMKDKCNDPERLHSFLILSERIL
jgi:hypothetical protein